MLSLSRSLQIILLLSLLLLLIILSPLFAQGDTDPPHVVSFDFETKTINTALSPQIITFTVHLTDDLSGVMGEGSHSPTQVRFYGPSGIQLTTAVFRSSRHLIWGNALNGIYANFVELPQYCEPGTWELHHFSLVDQVGNSKQLYKDDMIDLGFPVEFLVIDDIHRAYLPAVMK